MPGPINLVERVFGCDALMTGADPHIRGRADFPACRIVDVYQGIVTAAREFVAVSGANGVGGVVGETCLPNCVRLAVETVPGRHQVWLAIVLTLHEKTC